ncbi:putative phospholipase D [Helianthus anomalus]
MLEHDSNPQWYESFHIYCAHMASNLIFTVKEDDTIGATLLGRAYIPVTKLLTQEIIDEWIEIMNERGKSVHGHPKIHVKVQFLDVTRECQWSKGIQSVKFPGVPFTFFPQRKETGVMIRSLSRHRRSCFRMTTKHEMFNYKPEDAARAGLISRKDNIIDRSIQDGYINAIRRAKNFLYIENQYFLGSSFWWNSNDIIDEDISALHLITKELSLKIASKIEAGEDFPVYIVIPMWPEGEPENKSIQAILDWQRRTMQMMYCLRPIKCVLF